MTGRVELLRAKRDPTTKEIFLEPTGEEFPLGCNDRIEGKNPLGGKLVVVGLESGKGVWHRSGNYSFSGSILTPEDTSVLHVLDSPRGTVKITPT